MDKVDQVTGAVGYAFDQRPCQVGIALDHIAEVRTRNPPENDISIGNRCSRIRSTVQRGHIIKGVAALHEAQRLFPAIFRETADFDRAFLNQVKTGHRFALQPEGVGADGGGAGAADLVAFGRPFISNPDLVRRLRDDTGLNKLDTRTLYGGGATGYTDYPTLDQLTAA